MPITFVGVAHMIKCLFQVGLATMPIQLHLNRIGLRMEYALCLGLLCLLYAVLNFFRKAAERRRQMHLRSVAMPESGNGPDRYVCVLLTGGRSGSYILPSSEK